MDCKTIFYEENKLKVVSTYSTKEPVYQMDILSAGTRIERRAYMFVPF